jgi:hypothetical protein
VNDVIKTLIRQFMPFAQKKMGFSRPPKLFLRNDPQNAADPLGKTGFYDPQAESITLYTTGRHPKDIMRSLAHELQHHTQKCNGDFANASNMGEQGYAQNDPHMRTMEIEAYKASIVFRDWEDSLKETIYYEHLQKGDNSKMSTQDWKNGELKSLLAEAWGFKMDLSKLNEKADKNTGMSGVKGDDDDDTYMGHIKEDEKPDENDDGIPDYAQDGKGANDLGKPKIKEGDTGASKGDKEKDPDDPEALDYEHGGDRKGDKSKTHKGKDYMNEDSGEDEKRHYEDDDWHDKDRIEAIRRHLDALEHDKDYDHDHEELEEGGLARRKGDPRDRRGHESDRLRESINKLRRAGLSNSDIQKLLNRTAYRALKG